MNTADYITKIQGMIDDGIRNKVYEPAVDKTLKDLKQFQDFLYRNFRKFEHYDKMKPVSNQPARIYGTAKTHKFNNQTEITLESLKFRPIIAQNGTYTYNAAKVIADYLKPLCSNHDYIIRNTQDLSTLISTQPILQPNEEYVSYDVESLFTNIPIIETIDYIIDLICNQHKLPIICSKLIFRRLLLKLTTENTFIFQSKYYKQTDGCTMGGPLSVIFADIFMMKLEKHVVEPIKPAFYKRYVDDVITRRKQNTTDTLFTKINNYHKNIKFTLESSPDKFLDTKIIYNDGHVKTEVHRKETKLPINWNSKVPKRYKRNAINGDLYRSKHILEFQKRN